MAKRYQPQALLGEQGGVQTFSGRDTLNGLPIRLYSFMGEPMGRPGDLTSPYIPPLLEVSHTNGAGEVVTAFSPEFRSLRGAVPPQQVEALLRHTAAALDDAARAGVVHGDLSPERILFEPEAGFGEAGFGGRFLLEGYGVPWRVRPSEFSPPERIGGASFAGDVFSWAMTVRHLSGPLPGDLRDLLARCLSADPQTRPHAREVRAALESYPFSARPASPHPQAKPDDSAFETFVAGGSEEDDNDLTPKETSGWHIPLRLPSTPLETTSRSRDTRPGVSPVTDPPNNVIQDMPSVAPSAPAQQRPPEPIIQEANLSPDTLRRIDGTSAYRERRERHQAGQKQPSPPPQLRPKLPRRDSAFLTVADAPQPAQEPPQGERGAPVAPTDRKDGGKPPLEPVSAPNLEDDFDVIDDIDERAPDPTRAPGGRRVLLLTLLVIAILVLVALNLFSL